MDKEYCRKMMYKGKDTMKSVKKADFMVFLKKILDYLGKKCIIEK